MAISCTELFTLKNDYPIWGQPFNQLLAVIVGMAEQQIDYYQLVQEADAIGLTEKEAFLYFRGSLRTPKDAPDPMERTTYFKYLRRVKDRKKDMIFNLAKHLPEVHVTQITSISIIRKRLYTVFLSTESPKLMCEIAKTIVDVERAISEYNGWTQKITEETLKQFDATKTEGPALHPPS